MSNFVYVNITHVSYIIERWHMVVLHLINLALLTLCTCLHSIYKPTNALRRTMHMTHINSCISVSLIELFPCNFVLVNRYCLFSVCKLNVIFTPLLFTVNILSNKWTSWYNTHDISFVIVHAVHMLDNRPLLITSGSFILFYLSSYCDIRSYFWSANFPLALISFPIMAAGRNMLRL
jgi:hypothetical protein